MIIMKSYKKYISIFTVLTLVLLFSATITRVSKINLNSKLDKQKDSDVNYKHDDFLGNLHTSQAEDVYEENDIRTSAYDLTLYENTWLSTIGGFGVQKDDDWYEIEITTGYLRLVVHLLFYDNEGDIDISVYNSVGTWVTGKTSTTDNEYIDYTLPSSGTYYLRIYYGNAGNTYDLLWDDISTGATDDYYENNDGYTTAYDISSNERVWLSSISGLGIQSDQDWYEIYVNFDALRVIVFCIFSHLAGNVDIELYDSTLTLLTTSWSTTDNEGLDYTVSSSGTYYILVYWGNGGNTYDLWWDDLPSTDDWYEDNDIRTSAYDLSSAENTWLSESSNGLGIQSDNDWYKIDITSGYEHLAVSLTFSDAAGNINIQVYDSTGYLIMGSYSATDDEYIDIILPTSGIYYLRIYGDNYGNLYDLWWDDLIRPTDDTYEQNDVYSTAYSLNAYETYWLAEVQGAGIQADPDWYQISITSGYENLIVDLRFTHSEGDIDISIYASDGTTYITGSFSVTDNEYIDTILPSSGIYYIRVFGANAGNLYNLWWDDLLAPTDDNYEENDVYTTAYDLTMDELTWLNTIDGYGMQSDDDWYEIFITSGYENLLVNCTFSNAAGDIDLSVYASDGTTYITGSGSVTDNEYIDTILPSSGTYYILVYGDDAGNTYDLWWDDIIPSAVDDAYEPNDLPISAYDLTSYDGVWLSTIAGLGIQLDFDCYEIYVPVGSERVVIECTFTHSLGDVNIQLWNTTGGITASFSTTDDEYIDFIVPSAGTHYIIVYGDNSGNTYDLMWDALAPVVDDAYEENDLYTGAYDLTSYPDTWLTDISGPGIQADFDFYKVAISTPSQRIIIDLTYTYSEGALVLMLTDNSLTPLAISNTTANNEHIDVTLTSTGTFYIIVAGLGAGNAYDLKYSLTTAGGQKPIPGYNVIFLIAMVFGISVILIRNRFKKLTRN